jgi:hypothetical protein
MPHAPPAADTEGYRVESGPAMAAIAGHGGYPTQRYVQFGR